MIFFLIALACDASFKFLTYQLSMVRYCLTMVVTGDGLWGLRVDLQRRRRCKSARAVSPDGVRAPAKKIMLLAYVTRLR